jgi:uncharacterized protein YidB (DUF937 family)
MICNARMPSIRRKPGGSMADAAGRLVLRALQEDFKMSMLGGLGGLGGLLDAAIGQHPGGVSGVFGEALQGIGGFDGVIAQLNKAGLGEKVNSWLGKGPNQPLTAEEIRSALSDQHLQQIASQLGIPLDQVAGTLAQHLPNAIDQASPNGVVVAPKPVAQAGGGVAGGIGGVGGVGGALDAGGKASA